jgi:hypothetical protein
MSEPTQAAEVADCTWCGEALSEEEAEHPDRDDDGDAICERCHTEHFMDNCSRCAELVDSDDLDTTPGQVIAIYDAAPVLCKDDLEPGYYRILKRPFFADGMIEGYFYGDALRRVADLDAKGLRAAPEAYCLAGPLCSRCRTEVEVLVTPNVGAKLETTAPAKN